MQRNLEYETVNRILNENRLARILLSDIKSGDLSLYRWIWENGMEEVQMLYSFLDQLNPNIYLGQPLGETRNNILDHIRGVARRINEVAVTDCFRIAPSGPEVASRMSISAAGIDWLDIYDDAFVIDVEIQPDIYNAKKRFCIANGNSSILISKLDGHWNLSEPDWKMISNNHQLGKNDLIPTKYRLLIRNYDISFGSHVLLQSIVHIRSFGQIYYGSRLWKKLAKAVHKMPNLNASIPAFIAGFDGMYQTHMLSTNLTASPLTGSDCKTFQSENLPMRGGARYTDKEHVPFLLPLGPESLLRVLRDQYKFAVQHQDQQMLQDIKEDVARESGQLELDDVSEITTVYNTEELKNVHVDIPDGLSAIWGEYSDRLYNLFMQLAEIEVTPGLHDKTKKIKIISQLMSLVLHGYGAEVAGLYTLCSRIGVGMDSIVLSAIHKLILLFDRTDLDYELDRRRKQVLREKDIFNRAGVIWHDEYTNACVIRFVNPNSSPMRLPIDFPPSAQPPTILYQRERLLNDKTSPFLKLSNTKLGGGIWIVVIQGPFTFSQQKQRKNNRLSVTHIYTWGQCHTLDIATVLNHWFDPVVSSEPPKVIFKMATASKKRPHNRVYEYAAIKTKQLMPKKPRTEDEESSSSSSSFSS